MATVRFSEQLKADIIRNAEQVFVDQIKQAKASYDPTWGDRIYDKLFSADDVAKFNNLPAWAMDKREEFNLEGFYNCNGDVWQTATTKVDTYRGVDVQLHFTTPRPWPYKYDDAPTGTKFSWRSMRLDFNDDRWDWLKEEFKAYTNRIFVVQARRDAFVDGVKKVIESYATLAPALKAWQPLWDLIPQEAKDRHLKIVERTKRSVDDLDVDLNSMTAAVTLSKITK